MRFTIDLFGHELLDIHIGNHVCPPAEPVAAVEPAAGELGPVTDRRTTALLGFGTPPPAPRRPVAR